MALTAALPIVSFADETTAAVKEDKMVPFTVTLGELTDDEREIILKGCLINYNRK